MKLCANTDPEVTGLSLLCFTSGFTALFFKCLADRLPQEGAILWGIGMRGGIFSPGFT